MSAHPTRKLTRNEAGQLLSSAGTRPPGGDTLAGLLAAMAAPPRDAELAGQEAAVTAFRDANLSPASTPRRSRKKMSATKLLVAKAVLAALGVSAGGGVVAAAATGHISHVFGGAHGPGQPATAAAGAGKPAPASGSASPGGHPSATPSPSLRGLCQAYTSRVAASPGTALDNPAFGALIKAAGGNANVAAYCTHLLAAKPGNAPATPHPTGDPKSQPTTHPTGSPAGRPTPQSSHPTGSPTTHPAGKPTAGPPATPTSHP